MQMDFELLIDEHNQEKEEKLVPKKNKRNIHINQQISIILLLVMHIHLYHIVLVHNVHEIYVHE